ncbi:MAG: SDR family oxidoreductase [Alphaproteobacteria bacterium]|jgi:NAD(P)-dependent dehydrogenase (short-subunit alcohol dehydrogenase family)|nr:SDR family oxidoreductase [Alphaproteobacteria bacterium]
MARQGCIAVTGASRGIGSAIVVELARRGYRVGCLSRKGTGPEDREVPAELTGQMTNMALDVTDEATAKQALAELAAGEGGLIGLVNNAGAHLEVPSHECNSDVFAEVLAVNVTAVFALCREAYPHLAAAGTSTIINLGSFFDKIGARYSAAYCASKAGVGAVTRCLAVEWAKQGIRVINVAPGYVATDLNRNYMESDSFLAFLRQRVPVGRPAEAEEVARLVGALYDEDLPFLTGETIYMDGGQGVNQ